MNNIIIIYKAQNLVRGGYSFLYIFYCLSKADDWISFLRINQVLLYSKRLFTPVSASFCRQCHDSFQCKLCSLKLNHSMDDQPRLCSQYAPANYIAPLHSLRGCRANIVSSNLPLFDSCLIASFFVAPAALLLKLFQVLNTPGSFLLAPQSLGKKEQKSGPRGPDWEMAGEQWRKQRNKYCVSLVPSAFPQLLCVDVPRA